MNSFAFAEGAHQTRSVKYLNLLPDVCLHTPAGGRCRHNTARGARFAVSRRPLSLLQAENGTNMNVA